jgi:hypothetical protein
MQSQEYLDRCTMMGEATLALLDWSDEAQEDLVLIALNGIFPPTLEACMRILHALCLATEPE